MDKSFDPHDERTVLSCPGDTLLETMEIYGISKEALAHSLKMSTGQAQQLLDGVLPLTEEIAIGLERLVKIDKQFWINSEELYREKLKQITQAENEQTLDCVGNKIYQLGRKKK